MSKHFAHTNTLRQPQRHAEPKHNDHNVHGDRAHKGLTVCSDCKHIFFKKEWIHPEEFKGEPNNLEVHYSQCPACFMAAKNLFEGEVVINDVPQKVESELRNLISAYGRRAMFRDSQHRILKIVNIGKATLRIVTSENQLAVKLAKKISTVFRGITKIHISHRSEPFEVERVRLSFV